MTITLHGIDAPPSSSSHFHHTARPVYFLDIPRQPRASGHVTITYSLPLPGVTLMREHPPGPTHNIQDSPELAFHPLPSHLFVPDTVLPSSASKRHLCKFRASKRGPDALLPFSLSLSRAAVSCSLAHSQHAGSTSPRQRESKPAYSVNVLVQITILFIATQS